MVAEVSKHALGAPEPGTLPPVAPAWAWLALAFVFVAVLLEFIGGQYSNSQVPAVAELLAPIAWPQAVRVLWWLAVAAAAAAFRYGERRVGIRRSPLTIAASVVPFIVFAVGIAFGASFSTWH